MVTIALATALGLTIAAIAFLAVRQKRLMDRMTRLDSRVRMLGIVEALAKGQEPPVRRHLRSVKGFILLPLGAAIGWARSRPASAAAIGGATVAGLTLAGLTLLPGSGTQSDDPTVVRPRRRPSAIVGPPERTSEAPRFIAPVVPDIEEVSSSEGGEPGVLQLPASASPPPRARPPSTTVPPPTTTTPTTSPPPAAPQEPCVLEVEILVRAEVCLPAAAASDRPVR